MVWWAVLDPHIDNIEKGLDGVGGAVLDPQIENVGGGLHGVGKAVLDPQIDNLERGFDCVGGSPGSTDRKRGKGLRWYRGDVR